MKVSSLVPTYGRFSLLRETLAFFLMQDHPEKELVILNDGPQPIVCKSPEVRVLNVPPQPNLGVIWEQLRDASTGELLSIWTDDDWYLPWHSSMAHKHITGVAWKPSRSWCCMLRSNDFTLTGNVFESSVTIHREAYYFELKESYGEKFYVQMNALSAKGDLTTTELNWEAPYVFLWDDGGHHDSGVPLNGRTDEERRADWKSQVTDFANGRELTPDFAGASKRFDALVAGTKSKLTPKDWDALKSKLAETTNGFQCAFQS